MAGLSNKPFGQYDEAHHLQMQPSKLQTEVSRLALERHEAKMKES